MTRRFWLRFGPWIGFLVAAIASYSAAELTSRRLRELTDAAGKMAGGNLSTRTRAPGHDEPLSSPPPRQRRRLVMMPQRPPTRR